MGSPDFESSGARLQILLTRGSEVDYPLSLKAGGILELWDRKLEGAEVSSSSRGVDFVDGALDVCELSFTCVCFQS